MVVGWEHVELLPYLLLKGGEGCGVGAVLCQLAKVGYALVEAVIGSVKHVAIGAWVVGGVERALKKYVKDGAKAGGVCPVCGHEALIYQEGSAICQNCGSSI